MIFGLRIAAEPGVLALRYLRYYFTPMQGASRAGRNCRSGWNWARSVYVCADAAPVAPRAQTIRLPPFQREGPKSCIAYSASGCAARVSGVTLDRHAARITCCAGCVRTFSAPTTLREVKKRAFFRNSCLRDVSFASGLETISQEAFSHSGLRCAALPGTLARIGFCAFADCPRLRRLHVSEGCSADVRRVVPSGVSVLPDRLSPVWGLQALRAVVLPRESESVGARWFAESLVESVFVPASITDVGEEAFFRCGRLREVAFGAGSGLRRLGPRCFA